MQPTTTIQTLSSEFLTHFAITEVVQPFPPSGQKTVYLVRRNGVLQILKVFIYGNERDAQEVELLKKYDSLPGIPCIYEHMVHNGQLIVFEEYIEGEDLHSILGNYVGDTDKVMALMRAIIDIMEPVWNDKVVHRDLKPKNIKILPDGTPVILDFGIARDLSADSLTGTGDGQPMTWDYASPEQYSGEKDSITYRTDFFSLGLIAYQLYYGSHPFGDSRDSIGAKFVRSDNQITIEDEHPLNKFLTSTLTLNPSGRPRNVNLLKQNLI